MTKSKQLEEARELLESFKRKYPNEMDVCVAGSVEETYALIAAATLVAEERMKSQTLGKAMSGKTANTSDQSTRELEEAKKWLNDRTEINEHWIKEFGLDAYPLIRVMDKLLAAQDLISRAEQDEWWQAYFNSAQEALENKWKKKLEAEILKNRQTQIPLEQGNNQ